MMNELQTAYEWYTTNIQYTGPSTALVLLCVYSYIPRIPPKDPTLFLLWSVLERLTFLTWAKWGGPLKWIGVVAPSPEVWASEAVTKDYNDPPSKP